MGSITQVRFQRCDERCRVSNAYFPISPFSTVLFQLYATTSEDAQQFNGAYLTSWARIARAKPVCGDQKVQDAWFNWAEEQIALKA